MTIILKRKIKQREQKKNTIETRNCQVDVNLCLEDFGASRIQKIDPH